MKQRTNKRTFSVLLALTLVVLAMVFMPVKADAAILANGACGDNLTWTLMDNGVLTVNGTGPMYDWSSSTPAPWEAYKDSITSVVLREGVTSVGSFAFINYGVTDVTLPSSLTKLGASAFECCDLTSIILPENLQTIENAVFKGVNLTSVKFLGSAPTFSDQALYYITATCYYPETDTSWTAAVRQNYGGTITWESYADYIAKGTLDNNLSWMLHKDGTLVISGQGEMATSMYVDPWAGYKDKIQKVVIEEGVTSVGDHAFSYFPVLTSVSLPSSVKRIEFYAFFSCYQLKEVNIPAGVTYIGDHAFYDTQIGPVTLPNGLTTIGSSAFAYSGGSIYDKIDLVIPQTVTSLGNNAFANCFWIKSVTIPGTITTIPEGLFSGSSLEKATISEGVETIGMNAFGNCGSLEVVYLPNSLKQVANNVFSGSSGLKGAVYFGNEAQWKNVSVGSMNEKLTEVMIYCINGVCSGTCGTSVEWMLEADGTMSIFGSGAMDDYRTVEWISFTPWFAIREKIKQVVILDGVTNIGSCAFYNCYNMTQISIANTVTSINGDAFDSCRSLTSVTIPASVTKIGYAFPGCSGLSELIFLGDCPDYDFSQIYSLNLAVKGYYYCDKENWDRLNKTMYEPNLTWTALGHEWKDATCQIPATCKHCGLTEGSALGHKWQTATCQRPETCSVCGITRGEPGAHQWNGEYSCNTCGADMCETLGHDWMAMTCIAPEMCSRCGLTRGDKLPHRYDEMHQCTGCLKFKCDLEGHTWKNATCTTDKICTVCGTLGGDALGHKWEADKCGLPMYCTVCKTASSTLSPHKWKPATCTAPKTCSDCGATDGTALGHQWQAATCIAPKTCTVCGKTEGEKDWLGHSFGSFSCIYCDYTGGSCGDGVYWFFDHDANVFIYGNGAMDDYEYGYTKPWSSLEDAISTVTVLEGVTSIGHYAFHDADNLTDVTIADTVSSIGYYAFSQCDVLKSVKLPGSLINMRQGQFNNCPQLKEMVVPASVSIIEVTPFSGSEEKILFLGNCPERIDSPESNFPTGATMQYYCDTEGWDALKEYAVYEQLEKLHRGYEAVETAPTCDKAGYITYTCQGCGHSYQEETEPATGEHLWMAATCETAKTCATCGKTEGNALGHKWNAASCEKGKNCSVCGKTEGKEKGHDWIEATCETAKTCATCGKVAGNAKGHKWNAATCEAAKTCSVCKKTEGNALGHKWNAATCEKAKTCATCGKTEGTALGHKWNAATCETAKTCATCGKTEGNALGHKWNAASCEKGKNCSVCGKTEGKEKGHDWIEATCETAKTCATCGKVAGNAKGHKWNAATCETAKTCASCGKTEGTTAEHTYENGVCTVCGQVKIVASGSCTMTIIWTLDARGVLTLSGYGELSFVLARPAAYDVRSENPAPWADYADQIESLIVEEGITEIGKEVFRDCPNLKEVTIAGSVESVGESAFANCGKLQAITFAGAAPTFGENCFQGVTASVVHPEADESWTEEVLTGAGGQMELTTTPPEIVDGLKGDVDGDGMLSYNDALTVLRASIGLATLTPEQEALADFDGDGGLSYNDALMILRASIGL